MDAKRVEELKLFVEQCKSNPTIIHDPSLSFFKSYLHSLGARILPVKSESSGIDMSASGEQFDAKKSNLSREEDDDIVESDVELDNTGVVEPDNEPPLKMGDPTIEVTEEMLDAAQIAKSRATDAISEGELDEAVVKLTDAIMLNPFSSILYAARASVLVKMNKPNAAIRDSNAALQINPDSGKGYKIRGMARALLGQWEEAANDLHVASKLDYDEEIYSVLKKVEPNSRKIQEHRRKYERLRKEKELRRVEHERQQRQSEAARDAMSAFKDGQVMSILSYSEVDHKLKVATRTSRLVVLYFTATWCGPCRFISPIYTSLASKFPKVVFLKVDIDEARDVAAQWNISSVPVFFFIKNGKEIDKVVGADKTSLEAKIAQHAVVP